MSSLGLTAAGSALEAIDRHVPSLVEDRVASRLAAQDPDLWGPAARDEASRRLGWISLFDESREVARRVTDLAEQLRAEGLTRVVLAGMGGSSLAPEVIAATAGVELEVLDSTDPDQVAAVVAEDLERTVLVVSSKSGSTVETDSQRRIVEHALKAAGIDPTRRVVVVTDPGSPLHEAAQEAGYRAVFTADPTVGGRYSALTAFGLVPSALAGVDVLALLDEAEDALGVLVEDDDANPGLQLGAALGGTTPLRDKVVLEDRGSGIVGLGDWIEQLIAESTGKDGTGLLPVVVQAGDPETTWDAADLLQVALVAEEDDAEAPADGVRLSGSLGALLLTWEVATAVAGRLLGINPFDQPDVEAAKAAARGLLDAPAQERSADAVVEGVEVSGPAEVAGAEDLAGVLAAAGALVPEDGYLAVHAYLDRHADADLAEIRADLARTLGRPVTFGWGPRFLHSTGQYHKGGPRTGVFVQITGEAGTDVPVPGRPFTLAQLIAAQAAGDARVLRGQDRPVVTLHLHDRAAGVAALRTAARGR
ncbi:glucose-6-phosphate isomerase [Micrococcus sp.]|uniref:glucose-6-phosphate isomerase n=1 Tax=Micrococcus sp. TaxID=1271 RepID=UPI002A910E9E|nr:glucose-6-phosphate isomerase [Micrococcus sp.]MDY6054470.1 glucose-6-phosphate isomerase [Micrococcus sp.]